MEEYTPTTADIMECYKGQLVQTGEHSYEIIEEDKAIAEFGRWIKAERTRVAGMAIERERENIIKMFAKFADTDGYVNMKVSDITKLISGDDYTYNRELLKDFSWR
jgi:oligoribonuclease (3'-5' exoribonuclease)